MKQLYNFLKDFLESLIALPLLIVLGILIVPFILLVIIFSFIETIIDKFRLGQLLKSHEGKTFLIYADYNLIDFSDYLKNERRDLLSFRVTNNGVKGLLNNYLIKENQSKSYPRLTKISNGKLVHKNHYVNFKKLFKKDNDIEQFYALLDKSIKNLEEI